MNPFTEITLIFFGALFTYGILAALFVKKTVKRQSRLARAVHVGMLLSSFFLVYCPFLSTGFLNFQVISESNLWGFFGVALCAVGSAFCLWARLTLGRNWSGTVTLKKDHELVQRGPYGLVRHPMYTGILFALLGAAVTVEQLKGFMGVALLGFAFLRKMSLEDAYMIQHFDLQYSNYSKKIKRLIPFVY